MRRVDRSATPVPKSMLPDGRAQGEFKLAETHEASTAPDKKSFDYKAYKTDDVKAALDALFHGKCAYCETFYASSQPVDIEHYRPKNAVAEDKAHGGYWWLAMAWDNLLPSCIDCNRQRGQEIVEVSASLAVLATKAMPVKVQAGKKDSFPIGAGGVRATTTTMDLSAERALLLNPCVDDPAKSLAYRFDPAFPAGVILPVGDAGDELRGATSIQVYGLNRLKLVQDRTRLLRQLEFLGDMVIELAGAIMDLEDPAAVTSLAATPAAGVSKRLRLLRDRTLAELKSLAQDNQPYATMVQAWLVVFKHRIASQTL